ncbi:hypothetical protein [Massilia sp. S19_KUP03_FR1]|uniref:hypothetical protein n=1 Tax=Massilia sp. S19_KUP03_FR1 TaxID=3025503 RepID=UPI002FCCCDA6
MQTLDIRHRVPSLLAIAAAVIIVMDLFSTTANAGLVQRPEPAVVTQATYIKDAVKPAASKPAPKPLLEDEAEFAPHFSHVVARSRPGHASSVSLFGRVFSGKLMGAHPALL